MRMIVNKKVAPYWFLGFILAAYLKIPVLGLAILGVIYILTKFDFSMKTVNAVNENGEVAADDDF